jgi:ABC-type glycerol-3-phosphate transport system substrate-binding protein
MRQDDQNLGNQGSAGALTRRAALGALVLGGAAFVAFGPDSGKDRLRKKYPGRVILDYWEKWPGAEALAMQSICEDFNRSQDRIYVRFLTMGGAIDQKALVAIAGGNPPDVLGLYAYNVPHFAESGAIVPLDDTFAAQGLSESHYAPIVWKMLRHEGRTWAGVSTVGTLALYYNRAMFREAGLDRAPRTIEELDEFAARLTKIDKQQVSQSKFGFLPTEPGWWPYVWVWPFGGKLFESPEKPGDAGKATTDDPANLEAFRWVQSYPTKYGGDLITAFSSGFGNYDSPQQPFLNGMVGMVLQGPWLGNVIKGRKPDLDYGVAPFPSLARLNAVDAPYGLAEADILVVPAGSPHPKEAKEFIAYLQRREVIEKLAAIHCKNSPLRESTPEFLANHINRGVRVHDQIAQSPNARTAPRTRVWPQYRDEMSAAFQALWKFDATPEQRLPLVRARLQESLDLIAARRRDRGGLPATVGERIAS